ncbi:MAG: hypothetical protein Roseis2KO_27030 [Roseivirga sp.]
MIVVFTKSKPDSKQALQDKIEAYLQMTSIEAMEWMASWPREDSFWQLPLASPEEFPEFSREEEKQVNYRVRQLTLAIQSSYPLQEGEQLINGGYFSTYLTDDIWDIARGSVALVRSTTLGEIVFIEPRFRMVGKEVVEQISPFESMYEPDPFLGLAWGDLAINLAKGIASAIGGKIGSGIFQQLFPPSVPPYFETVYAEFKNIVQGVIDQNTLALLQGEILAIQTFMQDYNNLKSDPNNFQEAQRLLSEAYNHSVLVTSKLIQFPVIGLGDFSIAAGAHMAILQEKAISDPNSTNPNDSRWAVSLKDQGTKFYNFALANHKAIADKRKSEITPVIFVRRVYPGPQGPPVDASYYQWGDTLTGAYKNYPDRKSCCATVNPDVVANTERANYYNSVIPAYEAALLPVVTAATEWKKVIDNPIPV